MANTAQDIDSDVNDTEVSPVDLGLPSVEEVYVINAITEGQEFPNGAR